MRFKRFQSQMTPSAVPCCLDMSGTGGPGAAAAVRGENSSNVMTNIWDTRDLDTEASHRNMTSVESMVMNEAAGGRQLLQRRARRVKGQHKRNVKH